MNRHIWVTERPLCRLIRAFSGDRRGVAAVNFALMLPALIGLSVGVIELSMLIFDYHRAAEATRLGARVAVLSDPVAVTDDLASFGPKTCSSNGVSVTCTDGNVNSVASFEAIVDEMQRVMPKLQPTNVEVTYEATGLGDPDSPAGSPPWVSIRLVNVSHDFIAPSVVPGLPDQISFGPFTTSLIGSGNNQS